MFNTISGKEGTITIVELGAVIGTFNSWRLSRERKQDRDDYEQTFRFQGELQYINPALFADEDYRPQVIVTVARNKKTKREEQFRLVQDEGHVKSLNGRSLLMEGCRLVRE